LSEAICPWASTSCPRSVVSEMRTVRSSASRSANRVRARWSVSTFCRSTVRKCSSRSESEPSEGAGGSVGSPKGSAASDEAAERVGIRTAGRVIAGRRATDAARRAGSGGGAAVAAASASKPSPSRSSASGSTSSDDPM